MGISLKDRIIQYLEELKASEYYDDEIGVHYLPGEIETGICTVTARLIADKFDGVVLGYEWNKNPTALLGKDEFGHDFAIINDRWLVDYWAKYVSGEGKKDVYDLDDHNDLKIIKELYGDPDLWQDVSKSRP